LVRLDSTDGGREAVLALASVPSEPAHASLRHLSENPLGLIRQLEHRVQDLDSLRARTIARRQEAAQEAARARDALARPFKHGDDLQHARRQVHELAERMQHASSHPPGGEQDRTPMDDTSRDTPPTRSVDADPLPRPRPPAPPAFAPVPQMARHRDHPARQPPRREVER
jgi:hypothetical protein